MTDYIQIIHTSPLHPQNRPYISFNGGGAGLPVIQWEEFDLHGVRIRTTAGPLDFRWGRGITSSSTLRISKLRGLRPQAYVSTEREV